MIDLVFVVEMFEVVCVEYGCFDVLVFNVFGGMEFGMVEDYVFMLNCDV